MNKQQINPVTFLIVEEPYRLQRIDNYLITKLKGLPRSRLYQALRKGEIRVNKKRVKPDYKLEPGDQIRLPPLRLSIESKKSIPGRSLRQLIEKHIMFEDDDFIILNKPAGIAVHGGSGINHGVIEILRVLRPKNKFLELTHRLDKETSGCLLIAKKRSILKEIHTLFAERKIQKAYLLLVSGCCKFDCVTVEAPLEKQVLKSGERIVVVNETGKSAQTIFKRLKVLDGYSLLEAKPVTGRTHQIRVHAAYLGHPILGDEKYGDKESNKELKILRGLGVNQLCLHAFSMQFYLLSREKEVGLCALLNERWKKLWSSNPH